MLILVVVVLVLMAGPALAQPPAGQPVPSLKPVVVEGARVPDERTETEQEAREELQRTPGAVDLVDETRIPEGGGSVPCQACGTPVPLQLPVTKKKAVAP